MTPPIITKKLSKKKIKELDTRDTQAFARFDPKTKRHTIYVPYNVSTKTRLHEIRHCEAGHCLSPKLTMPVGEYISQEIDAEVYAFEKCGKDLGGNAIENIAHDAICSGASHSPVFNGIIEALTKHDYKLDRQQRSALWHMCREFEQERKRQR